MRLTLVDKGSELSSRELDAHTRQNPQVAGKQLRRWKK